MKFLRTLIVFVVALVSTVAVHAATPSFSVVDLGVIQRFPNRSQLVMNSLGWVAGTYSSQPYGRDHAFLFDDRGFHDLGTVPYGDEMSGANGINSKGDVIGWVSLASGYPYTTYYGFTNSVFFYSRTEAVMFDLNVIVTPIPSLGWLFDTYAISDSGSILAFGITPTREVRTYLLNPIAVAVPEPKVSALFFAGLVGLLFARKRYVSNS